MKALLTRREAAAALHSTEPTAVELLDCRAVCAAFGGTRPINPATLYRGIRKGIYPAPIKVGPGSSRWLRSEIASALRAMIDARSSER